MINQDENNVVLGQEGASNSAPTQQQQQQAVPDQMQEQAIPQQGEQPQQPRPIPQWSEVANNPNFQALQPNDKVAVQRRFFDKHIAPKLATPEEQQAVWDRFTTKHGIEGSDLYIKRESERTRMAKEAEEIEAEFDAQSEVDNMVSDAFKQVDRIQQSIGIEKEKREPKATPKAEQKSFWDNLVDTVNNSELLKANATSNTAAAFGSIGNVRGVNTEEQKPVQELTKWSDVVDQEVAKRLDDPVKYKNYKGDTAKEAREKLLKEIAIKTGVTAAEVGTEGLISLFSGGTSIPAQAAKGGFSGAVWQNVEDKLLNEFTGSEYNPIESTAKGGLGGVLGGVFGGVTDKALGKVSKFFGDSEEDAAVNALIKASRDTETNAPDATKIASSTVRGIQGENTEAAGKAIEGLRSQASTVDANLEGSPLARKTPKVEKPDELKEAEEALTTLQTTKRDLTYTNNQLDFTKKHPRKPTVDDIQPEEITDFRARKGDLSMSLGDARRGILKEKMKQYQTDLDAFDAERSRLRGLQDKVDKEIKVAQKDVKKMSVDYKQQKKDRAITEERRKETIALLAEPKLLDARLNKLNDDMARAEVSGDPKALDALREEYDTITGNVRSVEGGKEYLSLYDDSRAFNNVMRDAGLTNNSGQMLTDSALSESLRNPTALKNYKKSVSKLKPEQQKAVQDQTFNALFGNVNTSTTFKNRLRDNKGFISTLDTPTRVRLGHAQKAIARIESFMKEQADQGGESFMNQLANAATYSQGNPLIIGGVISKAIIQQTYKGIKKTAGRSAQEVKETKAFLKLLDEINKRPVGKESAAMMFKAMQMINNMAKGGYINLAAESAPVEAVAAPVGEYGSKVVDIGKSVANTASESYDKKYGTRGEDKKQGSLWNR